MVYYYTLGYTVGSSGKHFTKGADMRGTTAYVMVLNPLAIPFNTKRIEDYLHDVGYLEILPHTAYDKAHRENCSFIVWRFDHTTTLPDHTVLSIVGPHGCVEYKWRCPVCGIIRTDIVYPNEPERNKEFICDCPEDIEVAA